MPWVLRARGWRVVSEQSAEKDSRQLLRERLYVALVEQRVVDSQKYGEAPYAPVTWQDVDCVIPPEAT